MIEIYVDLVRGGVLTIEDIPERFKSEVITRTAHHSQIQS